MESNLLRTAPPPDSGNGGGPNDSWDREWTMMVEGKRSPVREGSLSIKLDLGVGTSSEQNHVVKEGKPVFTPSQLMELNQQALIFKYIAAGVSVPLHLVLPIWKSVASSFGPANGGIYNQYPSFVGLSPQGFAYGNMMDPEPGRCRRTDGKKWRCSKDAVHTQKYCERHMYRGRQRSRKHVEVSETAYPSDTTPPINNNTENANANLSISVPESLQIRSPHSNTKSISNNTATISSNINNASNDNVVNHQNFTTTLTTTVTTTGNKYSTRDGNENNDNSPVNNYKSANRNRDNWNINSVATVASPVLGFSPKSVLQCVTIAGRGGLFKIYTDPEPRRCRRTDGKRWRCNNDVVPDQKYCERHMYRGMKRQRHTGASTVAAPLTTTLITHKAADDHLNKKTNFSISIPEDSQVMINEGKSTTSECSSNTISNTSITNEYSNASSHTSGRSP